MKFLRDAICEIFFLGVAVLAGLADVQSSQLEEKPK